MTRTNSKQLQLQQTRVRLLDAQRSVLTVLARRCCFVFTHSWRRSDGQIVL